VIVPSSELFKKPIPNSVALLDLKDHLDPNKKPLPSCAGRFALTVKEEM
jgi:hypothetical protein